MVQFNQNIKEQYDLFKSQFLVLSGIKKNRLEVL